MHFVALAVVGFTQFAPPRLVQLVVPLVKVMLVQFVVLVEGVALTLQTAGVTLVSHWHELPVKAQAAWPRLLQARSVYVHAELAPVKPVAHSQAPPAAVAFLHISVFPSDYFTFAHIVLSLYPAQLTVMLVDIFSWSGDLNLTLHYQNKCLLFTYSILLLYFIYNYHYIKFVNHFPLNHVWINIIQYYLL